MLFTQQKSYHFYTTEILFQTVKEDKKNQISVRPLRHSCYPYPLDQRGPADKNGNF